MKNRTLIIISSVVVLLPSVVGLFLWNKLPEDMAIHFDMNGNADSHCHKAWAVFGLPLFVLAAHLFCSFMTAHDPKHKAIDTKINQIAYWICPLCSLFIGVIIYTHSLDMPFSIIPFAQIFIGIFIMIIGNYLPKCKQNYTVGIKLPWTLNDSDNWNCTHRFAGKMWLAGGLLIVLDAFVKSFVLSLAVIVLMIIVPILYSFAYYKKHSA